MSRRERQGRCYELAGKKVFDDPTWTLVHGIVDGYGGAARIGHAWCERDGQVWEPVHDQIWTVADYRATLKAERIAVYTSKEAARKMIAENHWGPWHEKND